MAYDIKRLRRDFKFVSRRNGAVGTIHCTLVTKGVEYVIYHMDFLPTITTMTTAKDFFRQVEVKIPEVEVKRERVKTDPKYKDQSYNPYVNR